MNAMKFIGIDGHCFQFLGIPPKGELDALRLIRAYLVTNVSNF